MTSYRNCMDFPKIFKDSPIQVLVGHERIPYYIHPGALRSCGSKIFEARTNESWMNGGSAVIDWTDFDEETVECVLSYLYIEDYHVQQTASLKNATYSAESKDKAISNHDQDLTASIETASPAVETQTYNDISEERPLTPLSRCIPAGLPAESTQTAAAIFARGAFDDHDELLGNAVLMHSKVYCFADRFLISKLEELALQRLMQVLLMCSSPSDLFCSRLADAVRLVYTSTPNTTQVENSARQLLSQYVALNYTSLMNGSFISFLSEGGQFMIDFGQKLARRVATSGKAVKSLESQIDELEIKIKTLKMEGHSQASLLARAKEEILEWESWNRGIPVNYRKARRVADPFTFGVL